MTRPLRLEFPGAVNHVPRRGHARQAMRSSSMYDCKTQPPFCFLESIGWRIAHGSDISPGSETLTLSLSQEERESYGEVVLAQRLRDALARLNPDLPAEAREDAFRKLTRPGLPAASPARAQAAVGARTVPMGG